MPESEALLDPSPRTLRVWNLAALAATLAMVLAVFPPLEHDLEAADGYGIVSLELAFTNARTRRVLDSWASRGALDAARTSLQADFAFLLAYGAFFGGWVFSVARRFPPGRVRSFGLALFPACLLAALFDATENALCLTTLYLRETRSGDIGVALPLATSLFASAKFAILLVAGGYGLAGTVRALR